MKTNIKQLATALLMVLSIGTAYARPITLPDPATSASESGTFTVTAHKIILTGSHVDLTTSRVSKGDIASGSARFKGGSINYHDGATSVDGQMANVAFGSQIKNGQVIYILKGQVFGKLAMNGTNVGVGGNFSVTTKPALEGTRLDQAQVDSSHLVLTIRSNINNTRP